MSFFIQQQAQYTADPREAIQPTPYQPCHQPSPFTPQASWDDPGAWLRNSTQDLMNDHPTSIVPGISPRQVFLRTQQIIGPYTPNDLWNVRCLSPAERHQAYVSFGVFGRTMQNHDPRSPEYIGAFDLVKERSRDIAEKEAKWYAQFADKRKGTLEQRSEQFKAIVVEQMHAVDIRTVSQAGSASSLTQVASLGKQPGADKNTAIVIANGQDSSPKPSRGQKRPAPEPEAREDCRPAKSVTPKLDESVRLEREAKAEAEHQRYLAQKDMVDRIYLDGGRSRKPTDPVWQKLAAFDAFEAAKQIQPPKKKRRQSSDEEDKKAFQDLDERFLLPSRDLASYPLKTPDRYMCLHVDSGCGGSKECTCHNHDCCRNGFTLRQLESAVKRKYERICSKIEEHAFIHGKISQAHKTWKDWYSKEMRDRDSTRVKACMPPLEWKPDPRMTGVDLAAQSSKAPRQAAAKKLGAKPQSALERLRKRQMEEGISQTTQAVVREAEESIGQGAEQASLVVPMEVCEGREQPDRAPLQVKYQEAGEPISAPEENTPENNRDDDLDVGWFGELSNEDGNNGLDLAELSRDSQMGLLDASDLTDIFDSALPISGGGPSNDLFAEFF